MSEDSSSRPQSPSNLLIKFEENIKKECRLVNEVCYPLNKNTHVSTGFSAARGFIPVVKMINLRNKCCVSFIANEWDEFLKYKSEIAEYISEKSEWVCRHCQQMQNGKPIINDIYDIADIVQLKFMHTCNTTNVMLQPIILIQRRDVELTLNKAAIGQLLKLLDLVNKRLQRLTLMDFPNYYNTFLNTLIEGKENINPEMIRETINGLTTIGTDSAAWCSEYTESYLEILVFHLEKLKSDFSSLLRI